jgi:hypothetical protein
VRKRWRWLAAAAVLVVGVAVVGVRVAVAADGGPHSGIGFGKSGDISRAQAGGCWNDGCNWLYYNTGGAYCYDAYRKSNVVYSTLGSSTQWWLEIRYSHACGSAYAYVHNLTESGANCRVDLWRSQDYGASFQYVTDEQVESPSYNFAYTTMIGDADANRLVEAQVVCAFAGGGTASSEVAREG